MMYVVTLDGSIREFIIDGSNNIEPVGKLENGIYVDGKLFIVDEIVRGENKVFYAVDYHNSRVMAFVFSRLSI